MTDDLVERVARAIADSEYPHRPTTDGYWTTECTGAHVWRQFAPAALAVAFEEAAFLAAAESNPHITNREQFSRCMGWTEAQDAIRDVLRARAKEFEVKP